VIFINLISYLFLNSNFRLGRYTVRATTVMERDAASREMGEGETFGVSGFAAREIWVMPFLFIAPHNLLLFTPHISLVTPMSLAYYLLLAALGFITCTFFSCLR